MTVKKQRKQPDATVLPDERRRALEALLVAPSMAEAARLAGCDRTTLWRWQQDPAFSSELKAARDAAFSEGLARLKSSVDDAVGRLRELLDSEDEKVRLAAAKAIVDHAVKAFVPTPDAKADADRDAQRELVEKHIALVMSEKKLDRDGAKAFMRDLPLPEGARKWLI